MFEELYGRLGLIFSGPRCDGGQGGANDGHFRQIIAEGISIVDGAGQELILIGFRKEAGTGIRILNKAGKRVLGIGIAADEGGSGILVADKEGRPRIGLGYG